MWEIKAAELSLSPSHKSGADYLNEGGKGVGARFPRFIRVRDDKYGCHE